jgi:hypothetical protein
VTTRPSTMPITPVPEVSTTTTSVPPAGTKLEHYQPWTASDTLAHGIAVDGTVSGGNCWTQSIRDSDNEYAWRCMAGNLIYDPCFAPPGASNIEQVACPSSPTSGVSLMNLSPALTQSGSPRNSGGTYAWYLYLSNGQACFRFSGAGPPAVDGVTLDFVCSKGSAAEPDSRTEPWGDQYGSNDTGPLQNVTVVEAWN